jgi:hypothetical protein
MLQLPLRQENEGQEPIVIKAAEQSTMMEEEGEMTTWRAKPARRQRLLTWQHNNSFGGRQKGMF